MVIREAEREGCDLAMACVMLRKESGGGANVYGHDRDACFTVSGRNIQVTEENYREYLECVRAGGKRNGVGPTQLTFWSYQEEADREGGCWRPEVNMRVGFRILAGHLRAEGGDPRSALGRYNGGPRWRDNASAVAYADAGMKLLSEWQRIVNG